METPVLVQEPCPDLIRDVTSEMSISLPNNLVGCVVVFLVCLVALGIEVAFVCFRSVESIEYRYLPFMVVILVAFVFLGYALESLVIPSHLRVAYSCSATLQVSTVEERFAYRLGFLVFGTCLLTWASTLSRSFAFYCILSYVSGVFMASFILLYQVMKRLPKELSSSAVFMYSALSSEDACLAGGALVCVLAVSPLLRKITRLIFQQSVRKIMMAKLLMMRDKIRDAVGPSVWSFHISSSRFTFREQKRNLKEAM